jgi:hypothetical protein
MPRRRGLPHLCAAEGEAILDERPRHVDHYDRSLAPPADGVAEVRLPVHGQIAVGSDIRDIRTRAVELPLGHGGPPRLFAASSG